MGDRSSFHSFKFCLISSLILSSCVTTYDPQQTTPWSQDREMPKNGSTQKPPKSESSQGEPMRNDAPPPKLSNQRSGGRSSAAVEYLVKEAKASIARQDWTLAQSYLERAFRLANRDPWVSFYMSKVLLSQYQSEQAEQWAFQALSYFDQNEREHKGRTWELIAACRRQKGDLKSANQAQRQADSLLN